jgi:hypothetical protein
MKLLRICFLESWQLTHALAGAQDAATSERLSLAPKSPLRRGKLINHQEEPFVLRRVLRPNPRPPISSRLIAIAGHIVHNLPPYFDLAATKCCSSNPGEVKFQVKSHRSCDSLGKMGKKIAN